MERRAKEKMSEVMQEVEERRFKSTERGRLLKIKPDATRQELDDAVDLLWEEHRLSRM